MPDGTEQAGFWGSKIAQLSPQGRTPEATAALQRMQQQMQMRQMAFMAQRGLGGLGGATAITIPSTLPPSPEVMGAIGQMQNYLGELQAQNPWQEAYNAMQGIIGQAGEQYGAAATRQARTAQQTGISAGFNPLEAQQAGQEAQRQTLQQYFALLPALQAQAAQFPIQQQQFMGGLAPLYGQIAQILAGAQQPGPTVSTQFAAQPSRAGQMQQQQMQRPVNLVQQMYDAIRAMERPTGTRMAPTTETIPGLYGLGGGLGPGAQMGLAQMLGIAPTAQQRVSRQAAAAQAKPKGEKKKTEGKKTAEASTASLV